MTVEVPIGKTLPLAGILVVATDAPAKSVAVAAGKVTTAPAALVASTQGTFAGQEITGGVLMTVTVKLQDALLPYISVAVLITVVVPIAKTLPLTGRLKAATLPSTISVAVEDG